MMKDEFQKLCNPSDKAAANLSEEEWAKVHTVYQFHPIIPDQGGKKLIAEFFTLGGMGLIRDMFPVAKKAEFLYARMTAAKNDFDIAKREHNEFIARYKAGESVYVDDER